MIKLLFTFSLLFISLLGYAQNRIFTDGMPKGTNVIYGSMDGSADSVLLVLGRTLQSLGYSIDKLDKDLLAITTQPREVAKGAFLSYIMNVHVVQKDSVSNIVFRGRLSGSAANMDFNSPLEWRGLSSGSLKAGFSRMVETVNALPVGNRNVAIE